MAAFGTDGTGTATTTPTALAGGFSTFVIIQNDPASTANLKIGFTSSPAIVLTPGTFIKLDVPTPADVHVAAASGTVTYNYSTGG